MNESVIRDFITLADKIPKIENASGDVTGEKNEILQEYQNGRPQDEIALQKFLLSISDEDFKDIAGLMLMGRQRVNHPADFETEDVRNVSEIRKYSQYLDQDKHSRIEYIIELIPASNTYGYFESGYEWLCKMQGNN